MTNPKKNSSRAPKQITEPAVDPTIEPEEAPEETPLTPVQSAVHALLQTLGHEPEQVASIEVTRRNIRVVGKDRSFRGYRIEGIA